MIRVQFGNQPFILPQNTPGQKIKPSPLPQQSQPPVDSVQFGQQRNDDDDGTLGDIVSALAGMPEVSSIGPLLTWDEFTAQMDAKQPDAKFIAEKQAELDALVECFPKALEQGRDALVAWVGEISELVGYKGISYDHEPILKALEDKGYKTGDKVGAPEAHYDPETAARWIIGQFMKDPAIEMGLFARKYAEIFIV